MRRILFWCGIAGPLVYAATTLVGGWLRPGYSQLAQPVSALTEVGAPNRWLLDPLFGVYNLCVIGFGIGLFLAARRTSRTGAAGGLLLALVGGLGILMYGFPMDPRGAPATFQGNVHLVLAGLMSLGSMLAVLLVALWQRQIPGQRAYVIYSLITLAGIILSGGLATATAATAFPYFGFIERITIGGFVLWLFVTAWMMLARDRVAQAHPIRVQRAHA